MAAETEILCFALQACSCGRAGCYLDGYYSSLAEQFVEGSEVYLVEQGHGKTHCSTGVFLKKYIAGLGASSATRQVQFS